MNQYRWLLGLLIILATPGAWARLPAQFLTCTGYGESKDNPVPIAVSTVTVSRADLLNEERLGLNFYNIVSFYIDHREGKFNGWFSIEDEGRVENDSFSYTKFSQLGKVNRQLVFSIADEASGHSFWRLTVKCKVSEK